MQTLNIITPCARPWNLFLIYKQLLSYKIQKIQIVWWIVLDKSIQDIGSILKESTQDNLKIHFIKGVSDNAIAGHAHRNLILEKLVSLHGNINDWVYNLDDDNLLHEDYIQFLVDNEYLLKDYDGVLTQQINKEKQVRLDATRELIKVCHVDTAMITFRIKALGSKYGTEQLRFIETDYCADGHFIEALYKKLGDKLYVTNTPLCYYNFLND